MDDCLLFLGNGQFLGIEPYDIVRAAHMLAPVVAAAMMICLNVSLGRNAGLIDI